MPQAVPTLQWFVKQFPWYEPRQVRDRGDYGDSFLDMFDDLPGGNHSQRLADRISDLQDGLRALESVADSLPQTGTKTNASGPATVAAKNLAYRFEFTPTSRFRYSLNNLARIIDVCTNVFRIQRAMERLLTRTNWLDRRELSAHLRHVKQGIRMCEIVRNGLPDDRGPQGIVLREALPPDKRKQPPAREIREAKAKLAQAATPEQELQILNDWRNHSNGY